MLQLGSKCIQDSSFPLLVADWFVDRFWVVLGAERFMVSVEECLMVEGWWRTSAKRVEEGGVAVIFSGH